MDVRFAAKGMAVASPLGYLDPPPGEGPGTGPPAESKAQVELAWRALQEGAARKELSPRAGVRALGDRSQEIAVQIPVGRLHLREDTSMGKFSLHATLAAELSNGKGVVIARFAEEFNREGALKDEAAVRETDLRMSKTLDAPTGKYKLHAMVRDWLADGRGEVTVAVDLAPPSEGLVARAEEHAAAEGKLPQHDAALNREALITAQTTAVESGLLPAASMPVATGESGMLVEAARAKALAYTQLLPNFLCVERIDRSTGARATGAAKRGDAIVELLRFEDRKEARTVVTLNGEKTSQPADRLEGARSNGEFGGILQTVFTPEAGATFHFERAMQGGADVLYVFSFEVPEAKSQFYVTDATGAKLRAGLHGLVYISTGSQAVRRLLVQTDPLLSEFGVVSSWMSLRYDPVPISGREYLLPTEGEVGLERKQGVALLQLRFSDYRRFGSRSTITYPATDTAQDQSP